MMYLKRISLALILCVLLYCSCLPGTLPEELVLFSGRPAGRDLGGGVRLEELPDSVSASAETVVAYDEGEYEAKLSILGGLANRSVRLRVVSPKTVTAMGRLVGIKLMSRGLVIIGFADFYSGSGLEKGDIVLSVNGKAVESYHDLAAAVAGGEVELEIQREDSRLTRRIRPVVCDDGTSRLGLWVRDSAAGVGTLTFVDSENGVFGALGHGISDSDTGVRFPVRKGTVEESVVASVIKGRRGAPGEITGAFVTGAETLGTIDSNTECGVFGHVLSDMGGGEEYPVGLSGEVSVGGAEIICDVGQGRRHYEVKILRVNRLGVVTKGILLEITDPELLERTGGIIQGM